MYFLLYLFILYCFVCSSSNSEPQREEILFEKVDKNLDGYLTKAELDSVFLLFDINRKYCRFNSIVIQTRHGIVVLSFYFIL